MDETLMTETKERLRKELQIRRFIKTPVRGERDTHYLSRQMLDRKNVVTLGIKTDTEPNRFTLHELRKLRTEFIMELETLTEYYTQVIGTIDDAIDETFEYS